MTSSRRRYVFVETAIGMLINTLISIGFVYLIFGGTAQISTAALIPDAVPQSFMIALMSTIVPTLLTRKRMRAGVVASSDRQIPKLMKALPVRALLVALLAAIAGLASHAFLLGSFSPSEMTFGTALIFKASYGAILAAIVTPITLQLALAEQIL